MIGGKRDYYKILGVSPISTEEEVKRAYRAASKKYHPDLNPDLKLFSEEKMRELVEAYEVLSDFERRKEYEHQLHLQIRKSRRSASMVKAPKLSKFKKEQSLLERVFSPFAKKKPQEAKTELNQQEADLHFTLGLSMSENESFYDQAIDEFRFALKYDPGYLEAQWNLGIMYYRKGQFDEAVVCFQKVLSLNREDPVAKKMIELLRDDY